VAVSAPENFMGLDATLAANGVQRPVLLIASRGDSAAFTSLQKFLRSLPNPDAIVYEGTAHGTDLLVSRPEAVGRIVRFLKRYAPLPTPTPTP
jgi:pimeloyl-ACP methyl ester carboxylesterase